MQAFIGEPVPPTATGVNVRTLGVQCQNDVDRDMVERIDYKLTVTKTAAPSDCHLRRCLYTDYEPAGPRR